MVSVGVGHRGQGGGGERGHTLVRTLYSQFRTCCWTTMVDWAGRATMASSSALLLETWCRRDGVDAEWTIPASVALAGMTRLACE